MGATDNDEVAATGNKGEVLIHKGMSQLQKFIGFLGPGLLVAVVYVDPGQVQPQPQHELALLPLPLPQQHLLLASTADTQRPGGLTCPTHLLTPPCCCTRILQIVVDMESGSVFEYKLLWALLLSYGMCLLFQLLCSRLALVSGRNLAEENSVEYADRATRVFLWLTVELASIAADLGYAFMKNARITTWVGINASVNPRRSNQLS